MFGLLFFPAVVVALLVVRRFRQWYRLRHIKGPFLATISDLWILRCTFGGKMWRDFGDVCNEYGPVVRVGPNEVVTGDLAAIRRMWSARSLYKRSDWYTVFRLDPQRNQITTETNDKIHGETRAKMASGYSGKENLFLEETIDTHLKNLIELIETKYLSTGSSFRPMDVVPISQYFTLDVITDLAFGVPFGFLVTDSDVYEYLAMVKAMLPAMNFMTVYTRLHYLVRSNFVKNHILPTDKDTKGLGKIMGVIKERVAERFGPDKIEKQDMLGSFIRHGLTQEEAPIQLMLQVLAGAETTATSMRMTILHLVTNPLAYIALRTEIHSANKRNSLSDPVQAHESARLPYLQAVIKEGLRIWPPVPGAMFKLVPPGGDTIAGIRVPENTKVGINWWNISRNKEVYGEDANCFRPERWLEAEGEVLEKMERCNELIFSPGKWACLGKNVALLELGKVFVELLRRFDFQLVDAVCPVKTFDAGIHLQSDLFVRVTKCKEQND